MRTQCDSRPLDEKLLLVYVPHNVATAPGKRRCAPSGLDTASIGAGNTHTQLCTPKARDVLNGAHTVSVSRSALEAWRSGSLSSAPSADPTEPRAQKKACSTRSSLIWPCALSVWFEAQAASGRMYPVQAAARINHMDMCTSSHCGRLAVSVRCS